jgi:hypothetical protein
MPFSQSVVMMRLVWIFLFAATLAGCGAIRGMTVDTGEFFADHLPAWAGGLPADAPPRPDGPRYEKYIHEESAKSADANQPAPTEGADNAH